MLQHTFVHIPKVSPATELKVWKNGVKTWDAFLEKPSATALSAAKCSHIASHLEQSRIALEEKDYPFFSTLPNNQHWRMYSTLKQKTCFLDIETTGLSKHHNEITLIGIHSDAGTKIFMNGKNLEKFEDELKKYEMIVTFNGRCFDVPFIKTKFPEAPIAPYHADLRFMMKELGFSGGLKNVEKMRGINRDDDLEGVDGFEAVRLWHRYQRGDNDALATLKKYLTADIENLRTLMDAAVVELKEKNFGNIGE